MAWPSIARQGQQRARPTAHGLEAFWRAALDGDTGTVPRKTSSRSQAGDGARGWQHVAGPCHQPSASPAVPWFPTSGLKEPPTRLKMNLGQLEGEEEGKRKYPCRMPCRQISFLRSLLPNFVLPEAILEMEGGAGAPSSPSPPCHGAVSGLKSPPATGETQGPILHLQSPFLVRPALRSAAPRARSPPWDFFFPTQWCSLRCSIPARTSRTSLYSDRKQVEKGGWQQKLGAVNTKQDSATGEREKVPEQRMGQGKSTKVRAPQPGRVAVGPLLRGGTWSQAAVAQGSPPHQHPIPSGFSKPTMSWCTRGSLPHPSGPHNSAPPPQT